MTKEVPTDSLGSYGEQVTNWNILTDHEQPVQREGQEGSRVNIEHNLKIGARLLAFANYDKKIPTNLAKAESDFAKIRKKELGEAIPQIKSNSERKIYTHLDALEKAVSAGGSTVEQSILGQIIRGDSDLGIEGFHLTKYEEISEGYWRTQEELYQNAGLRGGLSNRDRLQLVDEIRINQADAIKTWWNYLQDESCPYPLWFKLYVLDGVSRMSSIYDVQKRKYEKRDNSTAAPYLSLDEASLAKVFQQIVDSYKIDDEKTKPDSVGKADDILQKLVKKGQFAELYTEFINREYGSAKVPEKTEDVHGDWIEYSPGEEDKLSKAASCTPWCIISKRVAKNYLEYGSNISLSSNTSDTNKAKFYLFHLYGKDDKLSSGACASIRLNRDGNVAEISGLQKNQVLDDSLVPIVEEKVRALPGGEKYLGALEDKKRIAEIDEKWRSGEELSEEDIAFIKGPIRKVETYQKIDPRVTQIKKAVIPLQNGENPKELLGKYEANTIADCLEAFVTYGENIDELVDRLKEKQIIDKIQLITELGANKDHIKQILLDQLKRDPDTLFEELDKLKKYGVSINPQECIDNTEPYFILANYPALKAKSAPIGDVNELIGQCKELPPKELPPVFFNKEYLEAFLEDGADVGLIIDNISPTSAISIIDLLFEKAKKTNRESAININQIVEKSDPKVVLKNIKLLKKYGAKIDIYQLAKKIDNTNFSIGNIDLYIKNGADIDELIKQYDEIVLNGNLDFFLEKGADANKLAAKLDSYLIKKKKETLKKYGYTPLKRLWHKIVRN